MIENIGMNIMVMCIVRYKAIRILHHILWKSGWIKGKV